MGSTEEDAGITCYANDAPGFSAILKHRYSDFIVNEISTDGQVVHLRRITFNILAHGGAELAAPGCQADGPPADSDSAAAGIVAETAAREERQQAAAEKLACTTSNGTDEQSGPGPLVASQVDTVEAEPSPAAPSQDAALAAFEATAGSQNAAALRSLLQAIAAYEAGFDAEAAGDGGAAGIDCSATAGGAAACRAAAGKDQPPTHMQKLKPPAPVHLAPDGNKAQRGAVHAALRCAAFGVLRSDTIVPHGSIDQAPHIQITYVRKAPKRGRSDGGCGGGDGRTIKRSRGAPGAPPRPQMQTSFQGAAAKFCRFTLYKENMETSAALSLLAKMLHCGPSALNTAGNKDRRGVTVQHVTAFKVAPERLAGLNARLRGVRVGDFELVEKGLHLGEAAGNAFRVTLRAVAGASSAQVDAAAHALRESGFVNYFGLQRFGSGSVPTHRLGAALLRGDWEGAARMVMAPHAGERTEAASARRAWLEAGDAAAALAGLPGHLLAERALLQGLQRHGKAAYRAALGQIPRGLRTLYVHAYQSYLWNRAATHRVEVYGTTAAVAGDLVLPRTQGLADGLDCAGVAGAGALSAARSGAPPPTRLADVHIVSADEAAAGTFGIEDVVLPLPGARTSLPDHATAQVYHNAAAADRVSLGEASHGARDFSLAALPGDYRRLLHRPAGLRWHLLQYGHPDDPLARTDLDELEGGPEVRAVPLSPGQKVEPGTLLALQLTFQLPPSCYATMLCRELMKGSTATAVHRARTQAAAAESGAEPEDTGKVEARLMASVEHALVTSGEAAVEPSSAKCCVPSPAPGPHAASSSMTTL